MRYHTEFVVSAMEQKMVGFNLEEYVMERLAYNIAAGVMKKAHAIKRTDCPGRHEVLDVSTRSHGRRTAQIGV
jgi:hypothetical protein